MIAHVLTFAAHNRTLVVLALKKAGIEDLGWGDPMKVGGPSPCDPDSRPPRYGLIQGPQSVWNCGPYPDTRDPR